MGRRRDKRSTVTGIVLLDKPPGITSNAALQQVKRLFNARKAGHTGSLDPIASGLLPICLGEATKFSGFLLDADKRYRVECTLGAKTATGDVEGEVLERRPIEHVNRARVEAVMPRFLGEIEQIPPMYSALKHRGERLYRLARQGVVVERKPRRVRIYRLDLVELAGARLVIEVHCSKGTYVRTLAEDLGEALECGAHVSGLRRLGVGPFGEADMVALERLEALAAEGPRALLGVLRPPESALAQWPAVALSPDLAFYLRQGQPVLVPQAPTEGWVRLYAEGSRFLGVGEILADGRVAPRRLIGAA
ncbi:MAG: tRNA pseudouridine(55) synthase TruB [Gammaproteobacteria bacterium]|nr:tRNA pseudouridine(55) synthase TruB [Gammaproteobacteria bacterium]NIR82313.1 tRNA pseudouridine(55) synthase TruB [Gammaproteobacteria bacterium]NIU03462.1 tRNA pseudouridine(55) synthase TruB [Gammaproteobacteria bacterium]NIX84737.1 tRNA pseudouridine(55) synthase TruB [Gammaproteobacteria bacterium]